MPSRRKGSHTNLIDARMTSFYVEQQTYNLLCYIGALKGYNRSQAIREAMNLLITACRADLGERLPTPMHTKTLRDMDISEDFLELVDSGDVKKIVGYVDEYLTERGLPIPEPMAVQT